MPYLPGVFQYPFIYCGLQSMRQKKEEKFIYLAGPWGPAGGGMYRVMDYILQAQKRAPASPQFKILDPRGNGHAAASILFVSLAVLKLMTAGMAGHLSGLHVNMAERLSVPRKGLLIIVARLLQVPVVLHLHAAQMESFYAGLPDLLRALVRFIFSLPTVVVVLGRRSRDFVVEVLNVPPQKVEILVNGVPGPSRLSARARGTTPHLVFVGNLTERKGVSDLLAALGSDEVCALTWRVTFAGSGDLGAYRDKAKALGIASRVVFAGWTDQQQTSELLATADMLLLPSYDEGLPLSILEALAHGLPIICTPVGEIAQFLTHRETAIFVEAGDTRSLAKAIHEVLRDEDLRARLGTSGRTLYERCFSIDVFFQNLMKIYLRHFGEEAFSQVAGGNKR